MALIHRYRKALGASLIEVLVALLILSFGLLSLGGMMAYAVQLPKLSAYRATATHLAASHIERIRANAAGFYGGDYARPASIHDGPNSTGTAVTPCAYPHCTASTLADMDTTASLQAARTELPGGSLLTTCDPAPCSPLSYGNVWVVWQEPTSLAALDPASSDNCPTGASTGPAHPAPRCLYLRFKL